MFVFWSCEKLNHIGPEAFAPALMSPHINIHIDGNLLTTFLSLGTSVGNSKSIFYDHNTFSICSLLLIDEKGKARSIFMTFVQQSKLTGTVRFYG